VVAQASTARSSEVFDSFYDHLVYEMIHQLIETHSERPEEKQNSEELQNEVEQLGNQIGRKVSDLIALKHETKLVSQLEVIKFICVDVWQFVFAKKIDHLKTNNSGTFILIDE